MSKKLPKYLTRIENYWDGTSEVRRWNLERFVRKADNKHIVAYTDHNNKETIELCIGDSFEECETAMKKNLSNYKFVDTCTLSAITFQRPWLAQKRY